MARTLLWLVVFSIERILPWWRHQMEAFSALLAIWAGNSPVPGELPAQRPVTRSFDVFFDLHPNKLLGKQWWGWWLETSSCPLWRHRNAMLQVCFMCPRTIIHMLQFQRRDLGAVQATSHHLNQWWLVYRRIYASLGLNELNHGTVLTVIVSTDVSWLLDFPCVSSRWNELTSLPERTSRDPS